MRWIAALAAALALSLRVSWCPAAEAAAGPSHRLTLSSGDRVVFVGSALVERDQQYGYFETLLHCRFPQAAFTFRNLGWSGDTVWGDARAEFGTQADGYKKLVDEVVSAKPTVLLINYGMNESFAGEKGLPAFVAQYNKLLDDLSKTNAKVWLIGPNRHEELPPPLPDPTEHNKSLAAYTAAIGQIAAKRGCGFVDLFHAPPPQVAQTRRISDDGIHYTPAGAQIFGYVLVGQLIGSADTAPPPDVEAGGFRRETMKTIASIDRIAGPALAAAASSLPAEQEALRQKTIEKNREFFYRWRPQNDTYIFGFRKHEQGQNAVEIPRFDPIVDKLEREIARMSREIRNPNDEIRNKSQ
jgi:lysophospholipase L1-like esterase